LLKRKTPGKKIDFQLIAANVDVAFIVQSLNENIYSLFSFGYNISLAFSL